MKKHLVKAIAVACLFTVVNGVAASATTITKELKETKVVSMKVCRMSVDPGDSKPILP